MRKTIEAVLLSMVVLFLISSCGDLKVGERKVVLSFPEDKSKDIELKPILIWNLVAPFTIGEVKYDLYLSESSSLSPYAIDLTDTFYAIRSPLHPDRTYYWKVVAKIGDYAVESNVWSFTTVKDSPPSTPDLVNPENNAVVPINVDFKWKRSEDSDGDAVFYDFYLATNDLFSGSITVSGLDSTGLNLTLYPNTTYFWKVKAIDIKGMEVESVVYTFRTKDSPPIKPIAIYPEDGQEGVATPVKLLWYSEDPEGSALLYEVYFGESTNGLMVATSNISENNYEISQDLESNKEYYWKIVAIDPSSNVSESEIFMFKTR